jgi:phage replication O-like protein O
MMRQVRPVKPFSKETGYTQVSDYVLDFIMPTLSGNQWKVLCFVIRKTVGWKKESDALSYAQIIAGTGIKSDATVSEALKVLVGKTYILKSPGDKWEATTYTLNTDFEVTDVSSPASKNEADVTSKNGAVSASKNEDTINKGEKQEKHTQTQLRAVGAPSGVVCAKSKFSLEECDRYANHLHASGQGINNPGGYAQSIYRSGVADAKIERFLDVGPNEPGRIPTIDECPDCNSAGFSMESILAGAAKKCHHPKLHGRSQADSSGLVASG